MLRRLLKDRSGNIALLGALTIVPLLGTAGMALDVAHALKVRMQLQAAADAAVVGAIADKSAGVAQAMAMTGDGVVSLSESEARALFTAQLDNAALADDAVEPSLEVGSRILSVKVTKTGRSITSEATFSEQIPTTFLKIIGRDTIAISGAASATYESNAYMDFYLLLDNTPSMGVGATPADVDKLMAATKDAPDPGSRNCAFACHIVSESGRQDTTSNYFVARRVGATIRIDVVAQAVKALMSKASDTEAFVNQYRIAAYTFGEKAEDAKLFEVADLTDNLSSIKGKVNDISLMSIPYHGYNGDQITSFDTALTKMNGLIPPPGDGSSPAHAERVVYFVADGVGDSYKPSSCTKKVTGGRCQEPIDVRYCQAIKDRGIKIAVLYTTYLPLPSNGWYNTWIKPFQSQIGTKMEQCASPGLYFEVNPTQGIEAAMQALFIKIIRSPRLTG